MPLKKLQFKPGVNRENTRYATEGQWYETNKVRFRKGFPQKIGGWQRLSANTYLGVARSLWNWVTLAGNNLVSVGTNLKYYIEKGGEYYDITPIRRTTSAGGVTFAASADSLNGDIDDTVETITLNSTSGFPTVGVILIGSEQIQYNGVSGSDLTGCVRGYNGTTAAAHTSGDTVYCSTLVVSDTANGAIANDFVTYSNTTSLGGNITAVVLDQEYQIYRIINDDSYTINAKDTDGNLVFATSSDSGNGGASTVGAYELNVGSEKDIPIAGWSAGRWGNGSWGFGGTSVSPIRLWSQTNFGEDLLFAYRDGPLLYWDASGTVSTRGVYVSSMAGASDVPVIVKTAFVSDIYRFAFVFGANELGSSTLDPMLIRWSDQEDVANWTPAATNQAGSIRLSHGTQIINALQARQEILVWTDAAIYSLQYLGAPEVWGAQLLGDNITVASQNAAIYANNVAYWMGIGKFYIYKGSVQTLPCAVRDYVFNDFNVDQYGQVVCGSNEQFDEIWWFYPSANSDNNDRYVVYNYVQDIWYYGTIARTAWQDSDLREYPVAATYSNNLVYHEYGVDCNELGTANPITATITSAEFDLDDGDRFMLVNRMLPDITFDGSTAVSPTATMTLYPLENSGSGYYDPASVGGNDNATVTRTATVPVEQFTGQVYTRVRGRQIALKIESTDLGVTWKLGIPRMDIRPDGRRG